MRASPLLYSQLHPQLLGLCLAHSRGQNNVCQTVEVQGRKGNLARIPHVPQAIMYLPVCLLSRPYSHASVGGQPRGTGKAVILVGLLRKWRLGDIHDVTWECSFVCPGGRLQVSPVSACPERLSCLRCASQACPLQSSLTWVKSFGVLLIAVSPTPPLDNQRMLSLTPSPILELRTTTLVPGATPLTRSATVASCLVSLPSPCPPLEPENKSRLIPAPELLLPLNVLPLP